LTKPRFLRRSQSRVGGRLFQLCAAALCVLLLPLASSADVESRLVSLADVTAAINASSRVTLSAYTLAPSSRVGRALIAAAGRGADVSLVLDGAGMAGVNRDNAVAATTYGQAGVHVRLTDYKLHMKACVTDGASVFVSDRNWSASRASVILQLPASTRIQVERAILGQPESNGTFATRKDAAIALEAALLAQRRSRTVLVSTESFSRSAVSDILDRRARAGDSVSLVVAATEYRTSPSERALVASLEHDGVSVYLGKNDEKIAIDGDAGFVGSSNLSGGWATK
jgi:phosphatidylserine/phosphatidylglycerophosphate/cardiolipin synthase-like enzyme